MSRRKQSKPQHVEFADNKKAPLSNEILSDAAGTIKLNLRPPSSERNETCAQMNGRKDPLQSGNYPNVGDTLATDQATSGLSVTEGTQNLPEEESRDGTLEARRESGDRTRMASPRSEDADDQREFSADFTARRHGQFTTPHRSLLHQKYNGSMMPQRRPEEKITNRVSTQEEGSVERSQGDARSKQDCGFSSSVEEERERRPGLQRATENTGEMYNCDRCEKNFEYIGDFVQHKKFDCTDASSESEMVVDERPEGDSRELDRDDSPVSGNYVISGNVIMANQEDLALEMEARQRIPQEHKDCEEVSRKIDGTRSMHGPNMDAQRHEDPVQQYGDGRAETPNSVAGSEATSDQIQESPYVKNEQPERPESVEEQQNGQSGDGGDETEKLRKEIMATEAMASAIQNMTAFASHGNEHNQNKPDISAIKYQVRMIQQQQAYQVQMLNFLQWQLALASSNPQAAVAAAAAASSRNNGMVPGLSMNPGMQPPFMAGAGGGLVPQMMAAMAMNNFQNTSNESHTMAELAKARIMMGMQQASAENNQGNRNIFEPSLSGQEEARREEHRYQLKVATTDRETAESDAKVEHSALEMDLTRTKSDSGFDEDIRSSSANGGVKEDDTSSSHGSQEDGELRDNVLKSTAEEHRHKCRFCSKIFGSDSALQIHIRSHTGERPFKCNICGNRFTTKGNLKVHFTRHKSKYPHIPMNSQPVPEYLDHVPTPSGVPYGMSILPEKAVLERPRLHGNPSIHLSSQQAAVLGQRDAASVPGFQNFFGHQLSGMSEKQEGDLFRAARSEVGIPNGMGPADVASAIQVQLLQRRRAEYLEAQSMRQEEMSEARDSKNPMSILQAAMLPFLPGIAARQQLENVPPHLRYLLPHHLNALNMQNGVNTVSDNNNNTKTDIRLPTLPRTTSPSTGGNQKHEFRNMSNAEKMVATQQGTSSSETSKLQRLVENIDRGRVLQKNECHMCHRILSCQSALKLHYRTHTGERPYKCDLCSRAFTTRGNLRTHYSSVHRQQMKPLPPGGQSRAAQPETFSCTLCPARFRDPVEFQHHMQMHAVVQAQQHQQRLLAIEREKMNASPPAAVDMSNEQEKPRDDDSLNRDIKREAGSEGQQNHDNDAEEKSHLEQQGEEDTRDAYSRSSNDSAFVDKHGEDVVKSEPSPSNVEFGASEASRDSNESESRTPLPTNPLDSLAALSNIGASSEMPQHTGSMLDHQLAALGRARAGRLTVCEICEKPFSCQSALEIHLRTHTKERPFMCNICQRAFTTKGNLKQHLLTHNITDIPEQMLLPVSSPKNDNSASTTPSSSPTPSEARSSAGLKRPMDSIDLSEPSSKRTFPRHWCHICQKQFSSASSLQIHNRTHTGEKPFACNVCGRAFTTKGNLKVHMGTHVWGAGGSRRGRRISMDNPLISPWMKNMTSRPRPPQPPMALQTPGHMADPSALYQQYAAIASGLLTAKQDAAARFMLPMTNGQNPNSASSPVSSSGSPLPPNEMTSPQNRVNGQNPAVSAATEWFLKAYQRTQEQVN